MELEYVLKPYSQIAEHFDKTREYLWKGIKEFIQSTDDTSFLLDAGCGNGKNMLIKNRTQCIGFDFCESNNRICSKKGLDVSTINIKTIPYRDSVFDHSFTVAVLHHIEKEEDRLKAINELVRVTTPGGTIFIQVWSADIPKNKKFIKINNDDDDNNNDYFITWEVKKGHVIKRYYHLFTKDEFTRLLKQVENAEIIQIEEELGNWWGVIKRVKF
jgi:SAM-dependent methyltransferase